MKQLETLKMNTTQTDSSHMADMIEGLRCVFQEKVEIKSFLGVSLFFEEYLEPMPVGKKFHRFRWAIYKSSSNAYCN